MGPIFARPAILSAVFFLSLMSVTKEPVSSSNPFYGCAIFLIVILAFGGMVTWTIYSGWKQSAEIDKFTTREAPALAVREINDTEKATLQAKLDAFAADAKAKKPVTLTLNVDEMNQLVTLAEQNGVTGYRGVIHVTSIDHATGHVVADMRWKMNNFPLSKAGDRFLVGSATLLPKVEKGSFDLYVDGVTVPGKPVAEGFISQLGNFAWLNLAKQNTQVQETLKLVTSFRFSPEGPSLVLEADGTVKKEEAADSSESGGKTFFVVALCVFSGLILWTLYKRRKQKSP